MYTFMYICIHSCTYVYIYVHVYTVLRCIHIDILTIRNVPSLHQDHRQKFCVLLESVPNIHVHGIHTHCEPGIIQHPQGSQSSGSVLTQHSLY